MEAELASEVAELIIAVWGGDREARLAAERKLTERDGLDGYHAMCSLIRASMSAVDPAALGRQLSSFARGASEQDITAAIAFVDDFESIATLGAIAVDPEGIMSALSDVGAACLLQRADTVEISAVALLSETLVDLPPARRIDDLNVDLDLPQYEAELVEGLKTIATTVLTDDDPGRWETSFLSVRAADPQVVLAVMQRATQLLIGIVLPEFVGDRVAKDLSERVVALSPLAEFVGGANEVEPYIVASMLDVALPQSAYEELTYNQHFLLSLCVYVGLCLIAADAQASEASEVAATALDVFSAPVATSVS